MIAPNALPQTPNRSRERARSASRQRARRAKRRSYSGFLRVATGVALLALPVMVYVMLTAHMTSLNYALAHASVHKSQLLEETARLDDRIAHLDSREHLAAIAAQLNMHDAREYAVVTLPDVAPKPSPHGIAFLGSVGDWLKSP